MPNLLLLWCGVGLLALAAFSVSVVFRGLTENAGPELIGAKWLGRFILAVATVATVLVASKAMVVLAAWVIN